MQKGDAQNSCRLLQAYLMPDGSQPGRIRVNGDLACLWRLYCLDVLPACGRWDEAKALLEKEDPMSQFWSNENERQVHAHDVMLWHMLMLISYTGLCGKFE